MEADDEQKALEKTFLESWNRREEFYRDFRTKEDWNWIIPVNAFISELRNRGYDRKFLVAKPWHLFVLARSRLRDLRSGQASLCFKFRHNGGMRIQYWDSKLIELIEFEVERVEITPEIEALLERLLAQPVN